LKTALTAAQSNGIDDRFFLGQGLFAADTFSHQSDERVQIIGAGAGKTILRGDLVDEGVLTLEGNPDSSVAALTVEPLGGVRYGLALEGAAAQGVTVDAKGTTGTLVAGASLRGGATFAHGRVDLGTNAWYAVAVLDSGSVSGSTVIAHEGYGLLTLGSTTMRRSTVNAELGAVASSGHLTISDTVINMRGLSDAVGAIAFPGVAGVGTTAAIDLDRVTFVASAPDGKIGVLANADSPGKSATLHMRDSVISRSARRSRAWPSTARRERA
jgi:hypothetical protein